MTTPDRAQTGGPVPLRADIEVSFEFFPPSTPEMEASLWRAIERLAPIDPRFVSVTYGAGGTTRERTHATVRRILQETDLVPAAHLTCVQATRESVDEVLRAYHEVGVRHIVALRGDPPGGEARFTPHPGGYASALELVEGIHRVADFDVTVSAYPEVHPDAVSPQAELDYLKRKIDAGASRAITQFFFDNDAYLRFLERARAAGISAPIVPGILPVTNFAKVRKFATACGASVPAEMVRLFERLDDDPQTRQLVAATFAAEQCRKLRENGVNEFHFYTLNRAELTRSICHVLGLPARDDGAEREQRAG
ncbi:MAG: methylenetetrahydrofolate reductase [NAD(P)H] [Ectothiorhodospiraceae bacterium]|nr:methylenetetrahydrofolate reductase [NAD(P)H] [Chromatiales bacterium]MCP5154547.1 methylenetetrahydrofolate reductase [NAD(P)H] [Ectothiorhodospiraceae bacterium]